MTSGVAGSALMGESCVLWPQGKPGRRGLCCPSLGAVGLGAWEPQGHEGPAQSAGRGQEASLPSLHPFPSPCTWPPQFTLRGICSISLVAANPEVQAGNQETPTPSPSAAPWLGARILNAQLDVTSDVPKAPKKPDCPKLNAPFPAQIWEDPPNSSEP